MGYRWMAACLVLTAISLGPAMPARSQDSIPTPGPSTSFTPVEFDVAAGELPVTLSRIALDSGTAVPFGDGHDPVLVIVTGGQVAVDSSLAQVLPPQATPVSGTPSSDAASLDVASAGTLLAIPAGAEGTLTAEGDQSAALVVLELGEAIDPDAMPEGVEIIPLALEMFQSPASRVQLEIQRLALAHWATTDELPTEQARIVLVVEGAVALELEGGTARIGRGYGAQETLVAAPGEGTSANPEPDPEADPEADPAAGTEVPTPPVPPLSGTVAGLTAGDAALISGEGAIELQGASEEPASLLSISIAPAGER